MSSINKLKYKDQCIGSVCLSPLSPTNFIKNISDIQTMSDSQLLDKINKGVNVNTGQIVMLDSLFKDNNIDRIEQNQTTGQTTNQLKTSKSAMMINYIKMDLKKKEMEDLELTIQEMVKLVRNNRKYRFIDLSSGNTIEYEFK